jgi:dihydrolipoamide dehydrogenase
MSVALIEKDKVGGTCLHVGCIPTKALLHSAEIADNTRDAARFGVTTTLHGIDVAAVSAYRQGIIDSKYKGLQGLLKARGIQMVDGHGTLTSPTTVQVGDTTVTGKNVVLATGSYAKTIPGLDIGGRIMTSEQALTLDYVPKKVIVLEI